MARRSPPREVTYFERVPPRLARNTALQLRIPKLRQGSYFPRSAGQYCLASIGQRYSPLRRSTARPSGRRDTLVSKILWTNPDMHSPFPQRVSPKPVLTAAAVRVNYNKTYKDREVTLSVLKRAYSCCPRRSGFG
jgi:hypothetical protein